MFAAAACRRIYHTCRRFLLRYLLYVVAAMSCYAAYAAAFDDAIRC